jgi:hypothetical protein
MLSSRHLRALGRQADTGGRAVRVRRTYGKLWLLHGKVVKPVASTGRLCNVFIADTRGLSQRDWETLAGG